MNSRLDTIQAAILLVKLKAFEEYELNSVISIAERYKSTFSDRLKVITEDGIGLDSPVSDKDAMIPALPVVKNDFSSSWAQYTIQLPESIDRFKLQEHLRKHDIPTMIYYLKPMHKQEAFAGTYSAESVCPVTEKLCKTVLSLPMHPYMEQNEIETVIGHIQEFMY